MRIDKYLWCIRCYKTRSLATQACNNGQISIQNQKVKPSRNIVIGDLVSLKKNQITYAIKVIDVPSSRVGAKLVEIYRIDCTSPEELEKLSLIKQSAAYYREKGVGRPTKKDRRDIDDYQEDLFDDDTDELDFN